MFRLRFVRFSSIPIAVISISLLSLSFQKRPQWTAPASADEMKNPYTGDAAATAIGKNLFIQNCVACHGSKGKGDGIAGIGLTPPPGNLTSQKVQAQSDGALYWKITEGNPPMASYKTALSDTARWQLVNYLRELGANNGKKK